MLVLNYYRALAAEAEGLRRLISKLLADVASVRSPNLDGMPHGSTKGDGMDGVAAVIDRCSAYKERLYSIVKEQAEIETAIASLPPTERTVIRSRFIEGLSAERTAENIGVETRTVFNITRRAVDRMRDAGIDIVLRGD